MIKIVLRSIIFLFLIILGITCVGKISLPYNQYIKTLNDYNALVSEDKRIDIAIYGSSHAYCSYNPRIIDSITKTRSFNFGNDAERLVTTKFVLKETLKEIKPEIIVIDFYSATIENPKNKKVMFFQKHTYAHYPFTINKLKYLYELNEDKNLFLNSLLPLNRNDFTPRINFKKQFKYPLKSNAFQYRGFTGFDLNLTKIQAQKVNYYIKNRPWLKDINTKIYDSIFSEKALINFRKTIRLLKKTKKEVIFVVAPDYGAIVNKNYLSLNLFYKKLLKNSGFKLIDFNLLIDELNLTARDFKDKQHLNISGAKKVSTYLANYIKQNFKIPSRENELSWVDDQPKTLNKFIATNFDNETIVIDKVLNEDVNIGSCAFFNEGNVKNAIFRIKGKLSDSILSTYKHGFHTYVKNKDFG